jgi:hypothetical protein
MTDAFKTAGTSPPAGGGIRRANEQQVAPESWQPLPEATA